MANWRMFPPASGAAQTLKTNDSRSYSNTPGHVVDVPEFDARILIANGWIKVGEVGTTAQRPTQLAPSVALPPGYRYVDTSLSKICIWDGATWRDYAGASV